MQLSSRVVIFPSCPGMRPHRRVFLFFFFHFHFYVFARLHVRNTRSAILVRIFVHAMLLLIADLVFLFYSSIACQARVMDQEMTVRMKGKAQTAMARTLMPSRVTVPEVDLQRRIGE